MLHRNLLLIVCMLSSLSFTVSAKNKLVELRLVRIEAQQTSERGGDELYFTITEYPGEGNPKLTRVPMSPLHWLSKELPEIKNVRLWQGEVVDDSSTLLIMSLIEHDLPTSLTDDHLGSAQVKLENKGNVLKTTWGQPNFTDQPKVEQSGTKNPKFLMFGDGGKYLVEFKLDVQ